METDELSDRHLSARYRKAVETFVAEMNACAKTGLTLVFNVVPLHQVRAENGDVHSTSFKIETLTVQRIRHFP